METRVACEGKYDEELKECIAKIEALEAREDQIAEQDKAAYMTELDALRKKREAVWEKFKRMKSSGEDEWATHKQSVGNSIIAIQQALDESYSRFHK